MEYIAPTLAWVRGKRVVLISHDLSQTGSPLLLVEIATKLQRAGAHVELATLAEDTDRSNLAARHNIKVLPVADSFERSAQADLVIANTAETASWVVEYLKVHPGAERSLIWWIHEIDADCYAGRMHSLKEAAISIFDSQASLENWRRTDVVLPRITRVLYPAVDDTLITRARKYRVSDSPMAQAGSSLHRPAVSRSAIRKKLELEAHDFVVTLVGTYQLAKGHDLFLSAVSNLLRQHPDLPLKAMVIGFRNGQAKLNFVNGLDEAGQKALNTQCAVEVVGDLAPYYAASDAFVMNSQGRGENFGRVTIEAMTFRLPVLGTAAGGTLEIVEDGVTGLLHPVGVEGKQQLGQNMLTLIKDRKKAEAMGEAGYCRVQERFTARRFDPELGSIFQMILHSDKSQLSKECSSSR